MLPGQPLPQLFSYDSAGHFSTRTDGEAVRSGEGEGATGDLKDRQLPVPPGAGLGGQLPRLCLR